MTVAWLLVGAMAGVGVAWAANHLPLLKQGPAWLRRSVVGAVLVVSIILIVTSAARLQGAATPPSASGSPGRAVSPGPQDVVLVQTYNHGAPEIVDSVAVSSPVTLHGSFPLSDHEQLWPVLKLPVDPDARRTADRRGLYKVASLESVELDEMGAWRTSIDVGNGACDEGKVYDLYLVHVKTTKSAGYRSFVDEAKAAASYPEFTALPGETSGVVKVGHVRLRLVRYDGRHDSC